jgi:sialidase-1
VTKPVPGVELTDVFVSGQEGFHTYRIPAIIAGRSGAVLAFAEGRTGRRDQSQNKIVLKRSLDHGVTWSALQVIADGGARSFNNPCAVVEQSTGRIFLVFQSYPEGLHERDQTLETGLEGDRIVRNWILQSDDEGKSWSEPRDVTRTTKRPTGVNTQASGPGIGLQLRQGPHAGRLLIPFNEGPYGKWRVFAIYSDDRGQTWQLGEPTADREAGTVNEVQMVELTNGVVRFNARGWGAKGLRRTALSGDGGRTWPDIRDVPELVEPSCMAALLRINEAASGLSSRIIYSGPCGRGRTNGTVHLSYDDGETWPVKKTIYPGRFAYSGLIALPGGILGCLFERGEKDAYERITLARFSFDWLSDGKKP